MQLSTYILLSLFCGALSFSNSREKTALIVPIFYSNIDTTAPRSITVTDSVSGDKVFDKVEIEASFPSELSGWQQYLAGNLNPNTPVLKGAPAGSYTVVVQFIVGKDGSLSSIKPLTRHGYGMEAEVMRIIRKSPKWLPAQQDGRFVNAYRNQPITFVVEAGKKKRGLL